MMTPTMCHDAFGLKSLDLLRRKDFEVEDHWLASETETEAFKRQHDVETTPQTFIDGRRVGGYDDLRRFFGFKVRDPSARTYTPVLAVFAVSALMATATAVSAAATISGVRTVEWFIAFAMCILALLKLRDIESFWRMFLGYDLLAQRWVRYSYLYPFAELGAGLLMIAGVLIFVAAPMAIAIGAIGAVSVIKAVYLDRRELKCACVGGDSNVRWVSCLSPRT